MVHLYFHVRRIRVTSAGSDELRVSSILKPIKDITSIRSLREANSKRGLERAKKFSWERCVDTIIGMMKKESGKC